MFDSKELKRFINNYFATAEFPIQQLTMDQYIKYTQDFKKPTWEWFSDLTSDQVYKCAIATLPVDKMEVTGVSGKAYLIPFTFGLRSNGALIAKPSYTGSRLSFYYRPDTDRFARTELDYVRVQSAFAALQLMVHGYT